MKRTQKHTTELNNAIEKLTGLSEKVNIDEIPCDLFANPSKCTQQYSLIYIVDTSASGSIVSASHILWYKFHHFIAEIVIQMKVQHTFHDTIYSEQQCKQPQAFMIY